jgi:hypothetical protein
MNIHNISRGINFPNFIYYFKSLRYVNFKKHRPVLLGRWKLEECKILIDKKVDWANYDHCGTCGKNIIDSINKPNNKTNLLNN